MIFHKEPVHSLVVLNTNTRKWCLLPYPDHPRGCPNYGKRKQCPPAAPLIGEFLNLEESIWLVAAEFNLANHMAEMKRRHPRWSDRQAACCLYWQKGVRKELKREVEFFKHMLPRPGAVETYCPEAMGVNVINLARFGVGLPISRDPMASGVVFLIALVGYPANKER